MCWLNGLFFSVMAWHNTMGVSVEDRTRVCSLEHQSSFYKGESFETSLFSVKKPIRLRKGLHLYPSFSLGVENHKLSEFYHHTYLVAFPSIKASARVVRGLHLYTSISVGKGFMAARISREVDAPFNGYSPMTTLSIGLTISTDKIIGKNLYKKKNNKRRSR